MMFSFGHGLYGPYAGKTVTYAGIMAMLAAPEEFQTKEIRNEKGPWAIFSNGRGRGDANHRAAEFFCLSLDIDDTFGKPLNEAMKKSIREALRCEHIGYTTFSHTEEKPRFRVIIPFRDPVPASRIKLLGEAARRKIRAKTGLETDTAMDTLSQVSFLPSKMTGGQYTAWTCTDIGRLDPEAWREEIQAIEEEERKAEAIREAKRKQAIEKTKKRQQYQDGESIISSYNRSIGLEEALECYGYRKARNGKYLSPLHTSGTPGVIVRKDGKWISYHSSDSAIGQHDGRGHRWGDQWDLMVFYEYGGDAERAIQDQIQTKRGESFKDALKRHTKAMGAQSVGEEKQQGESFMDALKRHASSLKAMELNSVDAMLGGGDPSIWEETEHSHAFLSEEEESEQQDRGGHRAEHKDGLLQYSVTNDLEYIKSQIQQEQFCLWNMALRGDITTVYAPPNCGKTLLFVRGIQHAVEEHGIDPNDIIYLNLDDSLRGAATKLELLQELGIHYLIPGQRGFDVGEFSYLLAQDIENGHASNKILIVDTLRQLVDLMDSKQQRDWMNLVMAFRGVGGTMISASHTNKHRGADNQLIYAGTDDQLRDIDCGYIMDPKSSNGQTVITAKNIKRRGSNAQEAYFQYQTNVPYTDMVQSFVPLESNEAISMAQSAIQDTFAAIHEDVIESIKESIRTGHSERKQIMCSVTKETGIGKVKLANILSTLDAAKSPNKHGPWKGEVHQEGQRRVMRYYLT